MENLKRQKRGRLQTACSRCRERKIKCDKHRPCQNCVKKNEECIDDFLVNEKDGDLALGDNLDNQKKMESYWEDQMRILNEFRGVTLISPYCNTPISSHIIHVTLAMIASEPRFPNPQDTEIHALLCIESFKFQLRMLYPNFCCTFNQTLSTHLFTLFTQPHLFEVIDNQSSFGRLFEALVPDDLMTFMEYGIPFLRGSCHLGWSSIEKTVYDNCISLMNKLFLLKDAEISKTSSERLIHIFTFMGNYFDLAKMRLGSASSCFIICHDLLRRDRKSVV